MTSNTDRLKSYYHIADLPHGCSSTSVYVERVIKGEQDYLSGSSSRGCKINKIIYHCPKGEGDFHFADIEFIYSCKESSKDNRKWLRVFNPDTVIFFAEPLEVVN